MTLGLVPNLPAPLQVLLTGSEADWDRRLVIKNAPAFAIIGEEFVLNLRIEDIGAPARPGSEVDLTIHRCRRAGDLSRAAEHRSGTAGHPAAWRAERAAIQRGPGGRAN
jgi:hypothetical protein